MNRRTGSCAVLSFFEHKYLNSKFYNQPRRTMMKVQIKLKFTEKILFEGEYDSQKIAVEEAVKKGASLEGAYLYGAYLYGAYLYGANL